MLHNIIEIVSSVTKKPDSFLSVQDKKAEKIKGLIKKLYDYLKITDGQQFTNVLPNLILQDFDDEQIWQQLELQNEAAIKRFIKKVSLFLSHKSNGLLLQYRLDGKINGIRQEANTDENDNDEDDLEDIDEQDIDEIGDEEETDIDENDEENSIDSLQNAEINTKKSSIMDDEFFNLNEMNRFLKEEDEKEMQKNRKKDHPDGDDDINLFNEQSESASDDEEKHLKYSDYFEVKGSKEKLRKKSYHQNDEYLEGKDDNDNDGDDYEDDDGDEEKEYEDDSPNFNRDIDDDDDIHDKSSFEQRQKRLKEKIEHLENKALDEKPWQLKGEINATSRPQNSLLEEILEFDSTIRPPPLITEETTLRLDDIILQRIKDKAFDDVERKIKPIDTPGEFRKKLVLDQEKSKESLAQIYEKDYLKQISSLQDKDKDEEEPKYQKEIKLMMKALFSNLDALSNFHYTPKIAAPEIKIITNTPAIIMEEIAPVSVSDANLLAPEEIKRRSKGDPLGKEERSKTDKNRERRLKKMKQKKNAQKSITGNKPKNSSNMDVVESRNVQKMKESGTGKEFKSSTTFFSQLQDTVSMKVKNKSKSRKITENNESSAKRIKL